MTTVAITTAAAAVSTANTHGATTGNAFLDVAIVLGGAALLLGLSWVIAQLMMKE